MDSELQIGKGVVVGHNAMGTTHFYEKDKLLISVYKGRVKVELVIEHLEKLIAFYEQHPGAVVRSVVDISKVLGSFAKVLAFLESNYYPVAIQSGLASQVYVASDDLIIKNLSARLQMMASIFNLKTNVFKSRNQAVNWVLEAVNP